MGQCPRGSRSPSIPAQFGRWSALRAAASQFCSGGVRASVFGEATQPFFDSSPEHEASVRPLAGKAVVGPERHDRVDLKKTGPDEERYLKHRAVRLLVLGLDKQAFPGSITAVPNLLDDPRLAKIADQAGLGIKAEPKIDCGAQFRAATG